MRKFFLFIFLLPFILIDLQAQTSDLFFSEYLEGSSNNKAIEIYNGTGAAVDLSMYRVVRANNGSAVIQDSINFVATLADGDVYVIVNPQADPVLLAVADVDTGTITFYNGDDFMALQKNIASVWTTIDVIGVLGVDPGTAWNVAGVVGGTVEHTLVRKLSVTSPNTDWAVSAGTDSLSSEWLVFPQNTFKYMGFYGPTVDVTFTVDMGVQAFNGKFDPLTDAVHVSGSFNGWNTTADAMTDLDGDTIYTITKTLAPGEQLGFKFHKGVGDAGYETISDNRTFTVPTSDTTYSAYFNNDTTYQTAGPVQVTFAVDMGVQVYKGLFTIGTVVNVSGSFNGWNTTIDEMTDVDGDTIYTITKSIAPGEVVNFKFHKGVDVDAGYETLDNRTFTVPTSDTTYSAYFNNDNSYQVLTPVSVTFSCDMEFETVAGRFHPITDTLTTRGSFNGWSDKDIMSQSVGDPNIYDFTKTYNTFEGEKFSGKFAYKTSNGLTWENDPNKEYTITAADISNGYAIIERRFNNLTIDNVTNQDVTIKFTVNMAGAVSSITSLPFTVMEDVRLCGANPPLRWPASGWPNVDSTLAIKLNDSGTNGDLVAGDNIWSKDVVFAKYSPLLLNYKYGANWGLTSNTGSNDNESSSGNNHIINLTSTMLSGTVYNTWATMGVTNLTDVTGVENQISGTPNTYELNQNYPNPFNPSTLIRYAIPEAGIVSLRVYNLLGEEVATLVDGFKNAGGYEVTFDASSLSSGIYFYQINSDNFTSTKKMMLLK